MADTSSTSVRQLKKQLLDMEINSDCIDKWELEQRLSNLAATPPAEHYHVNSSANDMQPSRLQLHVKWQRQTLDIDIPIFPNSTVCDLMLGIHAQHGDTPVPSSQRLIYRGQSLEPSNLLSAKASLHGATLMLLRKTRVEPLSVNVRWVSGRVLEQLEVAAEDTVLEVKQRCEASLQLRRGGTVLWHAGLVLPNHMCLSAFNLCDGSCLYLLPRVTLQDRKSVKMSLADMLQAQMPTVSANNKETGAPATMRSGHCLSGSSGDGLRKLVDLASNGTKVEIELCQREIREEEMYEKMVTVVDSNFKSLQKSALTDEEGVPRGGGKFTGLRKGFLNGPNKKKRARQPSPLEPEPNKQQRLESKPTTEHCHHCARRVPLTMQLQNRCRCGHLFCCSHMHNHKCSFNHQELEKQRLARENPKINNSQHMDLL